MAKKKRTAKKKQSQKPTISESFFWKIFIIFLISCTLLIGYFKKDQIIFYYANYFKESKKHHTLTNSIFETERIHKITEAYAGKTFGLDISHYQRKEEIFWDKLTIANEAIPLEFIILRATMGNHDKDNHFNHFWKEAKKHKITRGAYHFYRPDEDPELQAQSYIKNVKLQSGDFLPVLDIEKLPKRKSKEQYLKDVQTWLDIVENHYGKKPIIYTYYYFYKDFLRDKFDDYPLWLANYNDVLSPSDEDDWKIWQFTEKGISEGANVKIDLNIYNGTKDQMQELLLD